MPKSKSRLLEPRASFVDPRLEPDFAPEHWPLCNGEPAPPAGVSDLHDRRCLEFLACFYRLNVLNSKLLAARQACRPESTAQALVRQIGKVTRKLEAAEDRYAPVGFFGEPILDGVRYHDIVFVRPELPRVYPSAVPLSSHIAISGLEDIPASELRGPARIRRFSLSHGKMDL
jgi:hypothetical protein